MHKRGKLKDVFGTQNTVEQVATTVWHSEHVATFTHPLFIPRTTSIFRVTETAAQHLGSKTHVSDTQSLAAIVAVMAGFLSASRRGSHWTVQIAVYGPQRRVYLEEMRHMGQASRT